MSQRIHPGVTGQDLKGGVGFQDFAIGLPRDDDGVGRGQKGQGKLQFAGLERFLGGLLPGNVAPGAVDGGLAQPVDRREGHLDRKQRAIAPLVHPFEAMDALLQAQPGHAFGLGAGQFTIGLILGRNLRRMEMQKAGTIGATNRREGRGIGLDEMGIGHDPDRFRHPLEQFAETLLGGARLVCQAAQ